MATPAITATPVAAPTEAAKKTTAPIAPTATPAAAPKASATKAPEQGKKLDVKA